MVRQEIKDLILEYKDKLLSSDNDITLSSIADIINCDKSVLYRNIKKIFTEEELNQLKIVSRKKAVLKYKKTWKEKYGTDNPNELESIKRKIKNTFIKNYGTDNPMKNKDIQEKSKNTVKRKYGVRNYFQSNRFKELISDKEFVRNNVIKSNSTKRKNHTFNSSKMELKVLGLLKEKFPDVKYQYYSEKYPFNCDFYIPSIDTYIEFNGMWTHGKEPFNPLNENHIHTLDNWKELSKKSKFYRNAINVWTDLDVRKRETAKQNNIKLLEFWNIEDVIRWLNKK